MSSYLKKVNVVKSEDDIDMFHVIDGEHKGVMFTIDGFEETDDDEVLGVNYTIHDKPDEFDTEKFEKEFLSEFILGVIEACSKDLS